MIEVRVDDLAFYEGGAIVRPATAELGATTALLRRLEQAAGPAMAKQLEIREPLPVGAAVVTSAGELPVELMVHAVIQSHDEPVSRDTVRRGLASALHRVEAWRIESVALAPFGLGAGNLDIEESAEVMMEVLADHLRRAKFPAAVTIVAERDEEAAVLEGAARRSGL